MNSYQRNFVNVIFVELAALTTSCFFGRAGVFYASLACFVIDNTFIIFVSS